MISDDYIDECVENTFLRIIIKDVLHNILIDYKLITREEIGDMGINRLYVVKRREFIERTIKDLKNYLLQYKNGEIYMLRTFLVKYIDDRVE